MGIQKGEKHFQEPASPPTLQLNGSPWKIDIRASERRHNSAWSNYDYMYMYFIHLFSVNSSCCIYQKLTLSMTWNTETCAIPHWSLQRGITLNWKIKSVQTATCSVNAGWCGGINNWCWIHPIHKATALLGDCEQNQCSYYLNICKCYFSDSYCLILW